MNERIHGCTEGHPARVHVGLVFSQRVIVAEITNQTTDKQWLRHFDQLLKCETVRPKIRGLIARGFVFMYF